MRTLPLALTLSLAALPAFAQTVAPPVSGPAPWWMDKPIIASTGSVWTEVQANRATTGASYEAIDRELADAQRAAAEKVRAVSQSLAAYGADKVRVESSVRIQPLYEQYRDRQGEVNTNTRADKVERYQVNAVINVEIRDVRLAERVYATLLAAKPSSTRQVSFRLEPDNETRTQMFKLAVADARRRALLATEAAGARLGAVRLIDPTGRACETDVLVAGAERSYGITVTGQRVVPPLPVPPVADAPPPPPPPPPPPSAGLEASAGALTVALPLQPPLQRLEARACVVYSLAGA